MDRKHPGRPKSFSPSATVEVKQLAGLISRSTMRILDADAIRPWFCRSRIAPRDPDFAPKAARVLDLYGREFAGRRGTGAREGEEVSNNWSVPLDSGRPAPLSGSSRSCDPGQ